MEQTPAHDKYNDTILSLLNELNPKTVAEVGCMRGTLAKAYLDANPNCIWHGIDIDAQNVEHAKKECTHVHLANIEKLSEKELLTFKEADTWIFADVLEHLYDPWSILEKIRLNSLSNLNVLACIPNSQHWSFQARINSGMMQYQDNGFFDRTHIRFFSQITMTELFLQSGYVIEKMISRNISFKGSERFIPHIRSMAVANGLDPDQAEKNSLVFQYVIHATVKGN